MKRDFVSAICAIVFSGVVLCSGNLQAMQNSAAQAPDNTSVNKGDRKVAAPTADQAKNTSTDRELMKRIRRDVVKDKSLSSYAHNVKIVADHGKITLKGPVHSEDEKRTIVDYATKYAGDGNVDDQLTVKTD